MGRFKELLEAKVPNAKTIAQKIVKELKGPGFGMTEAGGNGRAIVKGSNFQVWNSYYYDRNKQLANLYDGWNPKGKNPYYANYFGEKYNVDFKIVKDGEKDEVKRDLSWVWIEIKVIPKGE